MLGPLRFNGGPTKTQALLPGSPAIDAGSTPSCVDAALPPNPLLVDQRGAMRPYNGRCDIGAFEAPEPSSGALALAAIGVLASLARASRVEPVTAPASRRASPPR
jgi:hypothetical protein